MELCRIGLVVQRGRACAWSRFMRITRSERSTKLCDGFPIKEGWFQDEGRIDVDMEDAEITHFVAETKRWREVITTQQSRSRC